MTCIRRVTGATARRAAPIMTRARMTTGRMRNGTTCPGRARPAARSARILCYSDKSGRIRWARTGRRSGGVLPIPDVYHSPYLDAPRVFRPGRTGGLFGVELEVECGRGADRSDLASEVYRRIGSDFVAIKSDSSLTNGFEIVTARPI